MTELWYRATAESRTQALPLGNGRLGAMIYGGVEKEAIGLNEDAFWSGYPGELACDSREESFREIRRLTMAGELLQKDFTWH